MAGRDALLLEPASIVAQGRFYGPGLVQDDDDDTAALHCVHGKQYRAGLENLAAGDSGDTGLLHLLIDSGNGAVEVDGAAGILDDAGGKAEGDGILGGEVNAVVIGQAAEEQALDATLFECAAEACGRGVIVIQKGGVGVDARAVALADDQLGACGVEQGVEGRSLAALKTVIGP